MVTAEQCLKALETFNENVKPTEDFINNTAVLALANAKEGREWMTVEVPSNVNLDKFYLEFKQRGFEMQHALPNPSKGDYEVSRYFFVSWRKKSE